MPIKTGLKAIRLPKILLLVLSPVVSSSLLPVITLVSELCSLYLISSEYKEFDSFSEVHNKVCKLCTTFSLYIASSVF